MGTHLPGHPLQPLGCSTPLVPARRTPAPAARGAKLPTAGETIGRTRGQRQEDNGVASGSSLPWKVVAITGMTQATVTCAACGDRQTFQGSQWEVTVATEVWKRSAAVPPTLARPSQSGLTRRKHGKDQRRRHAVYSAILLEPGPAWGRGQDFYRAHVGPRQNMMPSPTRPAALLYPAKGVGAPRPVDKLTFLTSIAWCFPCPR